jgi:membrane protease YdiL (CAAX protease family)
MSSSTIEEPREPEPVAPWWHTALVLIPIAAGSVAGAYQQGLPDVHLPGMDSRLSSYLTVFLEEWFLVFLIWLGLRRQGRPIGSLVSGRWRTPGMVWRDFGLAAAFLAVAVPVIGLVASMLGGGTEATLSGITPKTLIELLVWLAVAATAGFCEELVFRGYLTRQFAAWTGKPLVAILLQGAVFGLAHGFYGRVMIAVMVQGWLLGLLARWRKSLRPGMLAHGLQDSLGGLVAFLSR